MQAKVTIDGNKAKIALSGHFTFEGHRIFKDATSQVQDDKTINEVDLDFSSVDYMDSAALGMLLLLNERMTGRKVRLTNCKGTVKAVLDVANFSKIFTIA